MRNEKLGNRYRILERIGEGGMAYIYVALDEKLGRRVAIKVLHEHMEANPDIRQRFQQEAQAISHLDHPNIVKIYDFSGSSSDRLWIVTEVIDGKNLAQFAQQFTGGWLHPVVSTCIVREICKALDLAHGQGIVHRDIKPENIMITRKGRVKLMDFGIAKDLGKSSMTVTGTFMGSPSYMSPEQIRGRGVDRRSDLYSLSVLYYEILTGRLPFVGQTTHEVVLKIMEGKYTYPKFIVPSMPESMNGIVVKGMSLTQSERYRKATEYGAACDAVLQELGFAESHVELERYFRDRAGFERRLAQTQFDPLRLKRTHRGQPKQTRSSRRTQVDRSATTKERPQHSNRTTQHSQGGQRKQAQRTQYERPTRLDRKTKHERKTQIIPAGSPGRAEHKSVHKPSKRRTRYETEQQKSTVVENWPPPRAEQTSAPFKVAEEWLRKIPPPPKDQKQPQRKPQRQARAPQHTPAPKQPAHARQRTPQPGHAALQQAQQQAAYIQARKAAQRKLLARSTLSPRLPWTTYALGMAMVALVVIVSGWGFWELQERLNEYRNAQTTSTKRAPITRPVVQRRTPPKPTPPKPVVKDAPNRRAVTQNPRSTAAQRRQALLQRRQQERAEYIRRVTSTNREPTANPAVTVETTEIRQRRVRQQPTPTPTPRPTSAPRTQPVQTPAPTVAAVSPPPVSGSSQIFVRSQPAAEIYLDGRLLGTTIDATNGSGWLEVPAGAHQLELRREGYEPKRQALNLRPSERRRLPAVTLVAAGQTAVVARGATLTLRTNLVPVQVTVTDLGRNETQAFNMATPRRRIELEQGRYLVKMRHNGATKERTIAITGAQRRLTFTAEFTAKE